MIALSQGAGAEQNAFGNLQARQNRLVAGKELRQTVLRSAHREWLPASNRADPIFLLEQSSQTRIPELIPLRYGRMMHSPFAFLRGAAVIMAADLATTPNTGLQVQACGDCHLMNFGGFASPERNLLFDLTDFDETLPAPWEWDIKRLSTSVWVAAKDIGLADAASYKAALAVAQAYRLAMREFGQLRPLEIWYTRLEANTLIDHAPDNETRRSWIQMAQKAFSRNLDQAVLQMTEQVDGKRQFIDTPPQLYHPPNRDEYFAKMQGVFEQYRDTLQSDRQWLLDRYRLVDVALKVVGVGSVGTHCGIALLLDQDDNPLILQYKEATASVLEPYAGKSPTLHNGRRIVAGQRLMQAASDIFLGWTNQAGQDFYFRQLRDMKLSIKLKGMSARRLIDYAKICACALARAHARSGDPAMISGYLGKSDTFDTAIADFAVTYATQVTQDHQALLDAIHSGRLQSEGR